MSPISKCLNVVVAVRMFAYIVNTPKYSHTLLQNNSFIEDLSQVKFTEGTHSREIGGQLAFNVLKSHLSHGGFACDDFVEGDAHVRALCCDRCHRSLRNRLPLSREMHFHECDVSQRPTLTITTTWSCIGIFEHG